MNTRKRMVTSLQTAKLCRARLHHSRLACSGTFPWTGKQPPAEFPPQNFSTNFFFSFSAKIHEDEVKREIQTTGINLAPEILQVFQNSQIFHDHKPLKTKTPSPQPATFTLGSAKVDKPKLGQISEEDSKKLLERLEEGNAWWMNL